MDSNDYKNHEHWLAHGKPHPQVSKLQGEAPPSPIGKGELGGECYRVVCKNADARWFNRSTRMHYCEPCAEAINFANRLESQRLLGGPLCVFVAPAASPPSTATPTPDEDAEFLRNYATAMRHRTRGQSGMASECADIQAPIFERIAYRLENLQPPTPEPAGASPTKAARPCTCPRLENCDMGAELAPDFYCKRLPKSEVSSGASDVEGLLTRIEMVPKGHLPAVGFTGAEFHLLATSFRSEREVRLRAEAERDEARERERALKQRRDAEDAETQKRNDDLLNYVRRVEAERNAAHKLFDDECSLRFAAERELRELRSHFDSLQAEIEKLPYLTKSTGRVVWLDEVRALLKKFASPSLQTSPQQEL